MGDISVKRENGSVSLNVNSGHIKEDPAKVLDRQCEDLFINFQINNTPGTIDYIKGHTTRQFFRVLEDDELIGVGANKVSVQKLKAQVLDVSKEHGALRGSVQYDATLKEVVDGQESITDVAQIWHFEYQEGDWLLAGIQQVS